MAAKSKSREPLPRKPKSVSDAEERIRLRAYQLYEERGRIEGHALDGNSRKSLSSAIPAWARSVRP